MITVSTTMFLPMMESKAHGEEADLTLTSEYWSGRIGEDHSEMQYGNGVLDQNTGWSYLNNTTQRINGPGDNQLYSAIYSDAGTHQTQGQPDFHYRYFQMQYETYGNNPAPSYGYMDWSLTGEIRASSTQNDSLAVLGLNSINTVDFNPNSDGTGRLDWSLKLWNDSGTTWNSPTGIFTSGTSTGANLLQDLGAPTLTAGETWHYQLQLSIFGLTTMDQRNNRIDMYIGHSEDGFGIPAPGGIALLGIGGAFLRRRRQ
jgi:hypothetical protein